MKQHDYFGFYEHEIAERRQFFYPPFCRIINIYLKHRDEAALIELSVHFSKMLREIFGSRILGPEAPMVARVQQLYIRQIALKMETEASMKKVKEYLRSVYENMIKADSRMKSCILYYDVDPV